MPSRCSVAADGSSATGSCGSARAGMVVGAARSARSVGVRFCPGSCGCRSGRFCPGGSGSLVPGQLWSLGRQVLPGQLGFASARAVVVVGAAGSARAVGVRFCPGSCGRWAGMFCPGRPRARWSAAATAGSWRDLAAAERKKRASVATWPGPTRDREPWPSGQWGPVAGAWRGASRFTAPGLWPGATSRAAATRPARR